MTPDTKSPAEMFQFAETLLRNEAEPIPADSRDPAGLHVGYYLLNSPEGQDRACLLEWPTEMLKHAAIPGVTFEDLLTLIDPLREGAGAEIAQALFDQEGIEAKYVLNPNPAEYRACHMAAGKLHGKGVGVKAWYLDGAHVSNAVVSLGIVAVGNTKAVRWMIGADMPDDLKDYSPTALATVLWREARRAIASDLPLHALVFTSIGPVIVGPVLKDAARLWNANPNQAVRALGL